MSNHAICKQHDQRALTTLLPLLQHLSKGFAAFKQEVSSPTVIPYFSRSSKKAFSCHDNVLASSASFIGLSENALYIIMCKTMMNGKNTFATNAFRAHLSTIRSGNSF
jgi:hypothetical protein